MNDLTIQNHINDSGTMPLPDLDHRPEATPRPTVGAAIQIKQLHKFYGDIQVLEDLNLHVQPSEFVAIVGRSGCGKSTLLRLIADLEQPSYGEINFEFAQNFSKDVENAHGAQVIAANIRVMFQDPRLLPWKTTIDNVQLGLDKKQHHKASNLLNQVGLSSKSKQWPVQLSGGQRQRTALARALSHSPKILLLDEPLGALDALTRLEMQSLIEQLWLDQGFTAILVTHDINEAVQLADRIILLDQGKIAHQFKVELPRQREKDLKFTEIEQKVLAAVLAT